jgi:UDP-glucose 4-epimerase
MKTYFITGVMGFIGYHWAKDLISKGNKVIGIDLKVTSEELFKSDSFEFFQESIYNNPRVHELVGRCDEVIHLASIAEPERYLSDPMTVLNISAVASIDIINSCLKFKKKIFFTSTSEIYGKSLDIPFKEDNDRTLGSTTIKRWCYSSSKAFVEHYLEACSFQEGLDFRTVRLFNIYGPNLKNRVVSRFIEKALKNEDLELNESGQQTRCFTYIDDAVEAFNLINDDKKCKNQIFNVGTTLETSIEDLAKLVIRLTNSKSKIIGKSYIEQFGDSYEDIPRRVPSIDKIKEYISWSPITRLEEGLIKTINFYRKDNT